MAQCKQTPYEYVQNAFSPLVAVLSSPLAEQICHKNNLSFIEMVQPFCRLTSEVHFRDPSGASVAVKNLRVCMQDVHSRPPQPTLARKYLNESVSSAVSDLNSTLTFGNHTIEVPSSTPWFEAWRETFLQVQFPADHEFTKHYLSCVAVVSTAEPSPTDMMRTLRNQIQSLQAVAPGKLPKWMAAPSPPLTYHLLLHDASEGDATKAESALTTMKAEYGANTCFLLTINSRPPGQHEDASHLPDPWSQFLTRHPDVHDAQDYDSSPRTPAEIGSLTGMPSRVTMDDPETAQEIGQEAVPEAAQEAGATTPVLVTQHPLSPQEDGYTPLGADKVSGTSHLVGNSPVLNSNVWASTTPSTVPSTTLVSNSHSLPHGACLTAPDLDRIRAFVHDMCAHALLPHIEKLIQQLSDQISNKKSVSRSLLGATKRWFGTNKPGSPSSAPTNAVIYSSDAPELQLRRLGDLCFMFRHYKLAFEAYHSAKRDFAADGAWLYYAGALEMASLSAFMMGESTRKAQEYSEEAILTYLNTCRLPQFATRGTLLSTECLKSRALYGEAARQLIRMTSEDSDLRSALLLEQAAYCFLQASRPAMLRKFAFHMVLAGHRFSKAGQKKHSLRCYQQAYQVYKDKGWSLAEEHIHFTIGRQAASLRQTELAVEAFARLFSPSSKQPPTQQALFLREFLTTHQQLTYEKGILPTLPLPLVISSSLSVLVGPLPPPVTQLGPDILATGMSLEDDTPDKTSSWLQLEEKLLTEAQGATPMIFKPTMTLFTNHSDNTNKPIAVMGEPVSVAVLVQNPMGVLLPVKNVHLLWAFKPSESSDNAEWIKNECCPSSESDRWMETCVLAHLVLEANATCQVVLSVVPRHIGNLQILGMSYHITNPASSQESAPISTQNTSMSASTQSAGPLTLSVQGKQVFALEVKRILRTGKERINTEKRSEDNRLDVVVVPGAPLLEIKFHGLSSELLCGEMQRVQVELSNVGRKEIKTLLIGSNTPQLFSIAELAPLESGAKGLAHVQRVPLKGIFKPGEKQVLTLWLRAPDVPGPATLRMLFYYEGTDSAATPRYRLVRHCWPLSVLESVQFIAEAIRSQALNPDEVLNINTRITNTNKVQDLLLTKVTLMEVSLASTTWTLSSIPVAPSQQETVLGSQESIQLLLRARRSPQKKEYLFSDVTLGTEKLPPSGDRPYCDFLLRHPDWSSSVVAESGSATEAALTVHATVILRWKAAVMDSGGAVRTAFGQHHLTLSRLNKRTSCPPVQERSNEQAPATLRIFGPDRNVPSESDTVANKGVFSLETMQQLVSYCLQHPSSVIHDFNRQRLCVVNVQLVLRNCCDSTLLVKINMANSSSGMPSKSQLYLPHASSVVRWVGRLISHVELAPRSAHTLPLWAAIPGPGTYNLGAHVQVWCRMPGSPENSAVAQRLRLESAIVIGRYVEVSNDDSSKISGNVMSSIPLAAT